MKSELSSPKQLISLFKTIAQKNELLTENECDAYIYWSQGYSFRETRKKFKLPKDLNSYHLRLQAGFSFSQIIQQTNFPNAPEQIAEAKKNAETTNLQAKIEKWEKNGGRGRRPGTGNRNSDIIKGEKDERDINATVRRTLKLPVKGPIPTESIDAFSVERKKERTRRENPAKKTKPTTKNQKAEINIDLKDGKPILVS